jgi:hypothetical protein
VVEYNDIATYLSTNQLNAIKNDFKILAGRMKDNPDKPLAVSKDRFVQRYISPRLNGMFDGAVMERCFEVFNYNGSSALQLEEFVCAVFILDYGSREELMRCK